MSNLINKQLAKVRASDSPSARDNLKTMATEQFSQRELDLQQQLSQAKLLNYISTQIHQTLDLPLVLQATVEQVQAFLHADRLIIYQFEFAKVDGKINDQSFDGYVSRGRVAYEAIGQSPRARNSDVDFQSVLNITEYQDCFDDRQLWDKYRSGMTRSIDRVQLEYAKNPCMLDLMARSQIQSKLVIPIVVNSELWGLLIAHQCQAPRNWQARETNSCNRFLSI